MRLCLFDDGRGVRLGHVRKNHIVDVESAIGVHVASREQVDALPSQARANLRGLEESCPTRAALLRRETVRIVDEWDA